MRRFSRRAAPWRRPLPALARAATLALALAAAACGDDDDPSGPPGGPEPIEIPTVWDFEGSLQGWSIGTSPTGTGTHLAAEGLVILGASGTPGEPDAWLSREVVLPDDDHLWIDVYSTGCDHDPPSDLDANLRITATPAGGTPVVIADWDWYPPGSIAGYWLEPVRGKTVTLRIEVDADLDENSPDRACIDDVTIFYD